MVNKEEFMKKYPTILKALAGATNFYKILVTKRRLTAEEEVEFGWLKHLISIYEDKV